jgi:hypothetical protein
MRRKKAGDTSSPSRDASAPELMTATLEIEGTGNAGYVDCTRSLACERKKHTSVVTTGTPDRPGIPCASGFNGFLRALLGEPGFVATIAYGSSSDKLDISVGISGPHDFAVRVNVARHATLLRPSHPAPNVRDDRETPLFSGAGRRDNCR